MQPPLENPGSAASFADLKKTVRGFNMYTYIVLHYNVVRPSITHHSWVTTAGCQQCEFVPRCTVICRILVTEVLNHVCENKSERELKIPLFVPQG